MSKKEKETILNGVSASPGFVEGKAKIITDYSSIEKMGKGDILIAPYTTLTLTPGILKAAGIVTEKGGKASHAAIVARERGIPCVVAVENATSTLEDGMEIKVDGKRGGYTC